MAKRFKLQDPGEGIHEAEILEVHISESEEVAEEDILLTIETDKAAVEVPSPFSGTIEEIRVEVGDIVRVGDTLMTYVEDGAAEGEPEVAEAEKEHEDEGAVAEEPEVDLEEEEAGEEEVAEEPEADLEEEEEEEEKEEMAEEPEPEDEEDDEAVAAEAEPPPGRERRPVAASPATRRLARELGVDLHEVEASGAEGRVTAEDVRSAAGEVEEEPRDRAVAAEERAVVEALVEERKPVQMPRIQAPPLPDFSEWGPVERVPLRSVRRVTAERMALAWSQVAHVTHQDIADITELERFRREHHQQVADAGGKLTLTVFVMKAVIGALKEFPRFNASLDVESEEIVLKRYYHIGLAVETDRGLIVPVVRDADCKTVKELAVELTDLAQRARDSEVTREDMTGGTFTISNPGPIGGTGFTPIINWPQVAILGIARAGLEPVIQGDLDDYEIIPRLRLPLALAFDHRVIDGADAAHFCQRVIELLGDPESLMLTA